MNLKLIVAKGEPKGKEVVISKDQTVIGRDPQCDLVIASSKVSRKHCRIDVAANKATVTDLGSRKGIFVNGQKVPTAALKAGDRVLVGPLGLIVEIDGDRGAAVPEGAFATPASATSQDINAFLASLEQAAPAASDEVIQLKDEEDSK